MRRYIQKEIEDKLANAMIFEVKGPLTGASVDIVEDEIKLTKKEFVAFATNSLDHFSF
mgnify:CR=1 FL=1